MKLIEQIESLDESAKQVLMQELSKRALRSITEEVLVEGEGQRYYIRDTNNNIAGNKKGYRTFKGANREVEHGKAKAAVWSEYYKHHEENPGSSNNLVHTIKLEEIEDETISELNEEQYGYHESNPKIDLHNKHSGEYIASTNYAKNVKQAVQKYEEKFPDMKGHVRGYINKK